jgi:DNA polymerase-1
MACSDPALQQIPGGGEYRRCFVARPGHVLVKADYSQIELRIAATIAGDAGMIAAYRSNADLHTRTAAAVLGKPEADVSRADRQLAKAINFGLLYGMGASGLVRYARANYGVALTPAEAAAYKDKFFAAYPGLARWHEQTRRQVQRLADTAPVRTVTRGGRPRWVPAHKRRPNAGGGSDTYPNVTELLNSPVQGTGADGLKAALALLWERRGECPGAAPVLVCHDEIVVETPAEQADRTAAWLTKCMADGMAPLIAPVPVAVEVAVGPTWGG